MADIVQAAHRFSDPLRDEENMPFWVINEAGSADDALPELETVRTRLMKRVGSNADQNDIWKEMMDTVHSLESVDVIRHFELTTGHLVEDLPDSYPVSRHEKGYGAIVQRSSVSLKRALVSRDADRPQRPSGSARRMLAGSLAVYLVVVMVSRQDARVDLKDFTSGLPEYSWVELGRTSRGNIMNETAEIQDQYASALHKLRRAQSSIWGYLPGPRESLLLDGISTLESAIAVQAESGPVHTEALLLLANAYIDAGQDMKALPLLETVISGNSNGKLKAHALKARITNRGR